MTQLVSLHLSEAVRQAAERASRDRETDLPGLIEAALTEHLRAKGYLSAGPRDEGLRPEDLNTSNDD